MGGQPFEYISFLLPYHVLRDTANNLCKLTALFFPNPAFDQTLVGLKGKGGYM
jgi:hypothetical protein